MAGNFNIDVTQTGDGGRLKLNGSFDGSSACELVNLLNNGKLGDSAKILVDTDALKDVHPLGWTYCTVACIMSNPNCRRWFSPANSQPSSA